MDRTWVAFGVLALVVAALWWYSSNNGTWVVPGSLATTSVSVATSTPTTTSTPKALAPKAPTPIKGSGNTYKSLLTQTGNYECDYTQVQTSGQGKNVIYMSGGKLRAEFRSMSNGVGVSNLAVYDGRYLYQWQEGRPTGTKTILTSLSQLPSAIPTDLTSGRIYGTDYESVGWNCHSWLPDQSLLAPPSYVTF